MRSLTLLRHAKSSWQDRDLADHERPLAERGRRDAPRMGERIAARGGRPALILTSSAKRALETAQIVARVLEPPRALGIEPALYLADPGTILDVIAGTDDSVTTLLVVGHNPGLTELVNRLLPDLRLDNLPTAGVVSMTSTAPTWRDVGARNTTLAFYDFPKNPAPLTQG